MQNLEDMCKEYTNIIYKYLFCITHNHELSEDLTQETLYYAYKYLDDFRGDCKIQSWLRTIARNEWYKYLNKHGSIDCITIDSIDLEKIGFHLSPEDNLVNKENINNIYKMIFDLDEESCQIVLLRLEANMSFKEISDLFHKNENWARVKFFRAKQILRKNLRENEE